MQRTDLFLLGVTLVCVFIVGFSFVLVLSVARAYLALASTPDPWPEKILQAPQNPEGDLDMGPDLP